MPIKPIKPSYVTWLNGNGGWDVLCNGDKIAWFRLLDDANLFIDLLLEKIAKNQAPVTEG